MGWKCKNCGGEDFTECYSEQVFRTNLVFDKEGICIDYVDEDFDFGDYALRCEKCNKKVYSADIEDIANWED